ncbi:MAG TPA: SAM-dependent methyltransferase [Terriglobales bacterium]|nr:SAM-dependent methyltransferase [Terriglobales bacterium]
MNLREYIHDEIRRCGPIPFSRFMQLCLYGATEQGIPGYYTRDREQFGKDGDFYTSSDLHAVFGRVLSRQFEQMWQLLGRPQRLDFIELGPGRGLFAADVLEWTRKKFPGFHAALRYTLVEISACLRTRLEQRFSHEITAGSVRVVQRMEDTDYAPDFIVFANEFFDALPVEVVSSRGGLFVSVEDGKFTELFLPARAEVLRFLDLYGVHPQAPEAGEVEERIEAQLAGLAAMENIAARLPGRGFMVVIDYGYTREEQLAGRHRGTLKGFRRHAMISSFYDSPGEQDITADVNFTSLAGASRDGGMEPLGLVTQAQFLMGVGEESQFSEVFEECRLPQEKAKVALQLKHLVTPQGMGESFHVLVLGRGVEKEKAAQLSGLRFNRSFNL